MSGNVSVIAQGRTDMQVTTRAGRIAINIVGGAPGPKGDQGETGPAGGLTRFEHIQVSPLAEWVINHDLGFFPTSVSILSPGGVEVNAGVSHISVNQLIVSFGTPYAGIVRIL